MKSKLCCEKTSLHLLLVAAVIYSVSFGIVLPFMLQDRVFSVYFTLERSKAQEIVDAKNHVQQQDARLYLKELDASGVFRFHNTRIRDNHVDILIVITTVERNSEKDLQYLTQVVANTHREIVRNTDVKAAMLICNVQYKPEQHKEAIYVSHYFPSVQRSFSLTYMDVYEKEKLDYMFCLEQGRNFNPQYVLLLEDDTVPKPHMLSYLKYALDNKILKKYMHGEVKESTRSWLATKLYYPEKWMGFSNDIHQLATLIGFACVAGGAFLLITVVVCHLRRIQLSVCSLYLILILSGTYALLLALVIGRPNLLEFCRIHPSLFRVFPAPGCCTPATLFPNFQIQGVLDFLNKTKCKSDYGLDLALDDYAQNTGIVMHLLVPNLFRHIGLYSTLSGKAKEAVEEFLFK